MLTSIKRLFQGEKPNGNPLVLSSFNSKFPKATHILWQQIDVFKWHVNFKLKKQKYTALFNSEGKWLETVVLIPFDKMPKQLQLTIEKKHNIDGVKQIYHVQNPVRSIYEMNLNNGVFNIKVLFDHSGKTIGRLLL